MSEGMQYNRKQLIPTIAVAAALALAGFFLVRHAHGQDAAPDAGSAPAGVTTVSDTGRRVLQIRTVPVRMQGLPGLVQATGLVSFPADRTVNISPRLQGRVRAVYVHVGDHVAAGQALALLDSTDAATARTTDTENQNKLRLAAIALQRNEILFRLGTPEVTQAEAAVQQAEEHTAYTRDALAKIRLQAKIGGFNQQPLEAARTAEVQARSALDAARQDLDLAQRARDRMAKLVSIGVNAQQDLEADENTLAKARVTVGSDQDQLRLAQEALTRETKAFRTNLYTDQSVRTAEDAYQAALLQQSGAARALLLARAAIRTNLEQSQSDYRNALSDAQNSRNALHLLGDPGPDGTVRVTAPIFGVITARSVSPGQVVDQSQETPWNMFTLSDNATVWVECDVYEKDLASVAEGQPVQVRVDALPGRVFDGVVRHIAPTLDPKSRAVKVRAEIANPAGLLKDGMFAEMTVHTGRGLSAPVIPVAAVQHDGGGDFVYVAQGGAYARRPVRLGTQKNGLCQIASGVRPGERVVTSGALFLGAQTSSD